MISVSFLWIFCLNLSEENSTMDDWDQETLEKVVASKSNEYNKNKPTDIVSRVPVSTVFSINSPDDYDF